MKPFYNLEALFYELLTRSLLLMSNSVYCVFSFFFFFWFLLCLRFISTWSPGSSAGESFARKIRKIVNISHTRDASPRVAARDGCSEGSQRMYDWKKGKSLPFYSELRQAT